MEVYMSKKVETEILRKAKTLRNREKELYRGTTKWLLLSVIAAFTFLTLGFYTAGEMTEVVNASGKIERSVNIKGDVFLGYVVVMFVSILFTQFMYARRRNRNYSLLQYHAGNCRDGDSVGRALYKRLESMFQEMVRERKTIQVWYGLSYTSVLCAVLSVVGAAFLMKYILGTGTLNWWWNALGFAVFAALALVFLKLFINEYQSAESEFIKTHSAYSELKDKYEYSS